MSTFFESGSSGQTITSPLSTMLEIGVGDNLDLKVSIKKSADSRWYPMIHKGWYYLGTEERYLFSKKYQNIINLAPSSVTTSSIICSTLDTSAISQYGPVFMTKGTTSYKRVVGSIAVMTSGSWTCVGNNKWKITVPGNVEHVISTLHTSLKEVPSSSLVKESDYFYFNPRSRELTVSSETDPCSTVFYTYSYEPTGSEVVLLQEELLVDANSRIRLRHENIATYYGARPVVKRVGTWGLSSMTIYSSSVSGNVIQLPIAVPAKEVVGVLYRVNNSFGLTKNHIHAYSTTSGNTTLDFEGEKDDYQDISEVLTTDLSYLQLNPMYSGIVPGFIYLAPAIDPYKEAARIYARSAPSRVAILSGTGCPVRIRARAVDKNNNPVAGVCLNYAISGPGLVQTVLPSTQITNFLGEVTYTWKPSAAGTMTMTISSSGLAVTDVVSAVCVGASNINYTSGSFIPKLFLAKDTSETSINRLKACITRNDGVILTNAGVTIKFISKNGITNPTEVRTNEEGIATVDIVGPDIIYASLYDGFSSTVIFSNEVTI